jgi:steroid delta-isomerase-like uncharacterized protein
MKNKRGEGEQQMTTYSTIGNQDTVQRAIEEVWNRGNMAVISDLYASEFVTFEPSNQVLRGREAFGQYVSSYRAAFPKLHFAIEEVQPRGDEVSVRWTATGLEPTHRSGRPISSNGSGASGMTIYRLASGKIAESWVHWDEAGMLQNLAAGPRTQ